MKSLFYCQHSLGIGHLVRTLRLAEASLTYGPVLVICGGELPPQLRIDPRIRVVPLPPLRMDSDNKLVDAVGARDIDDIFAKRARLVKQAVCQFAPNAVMIEMFPFGRKKFAAEVFSIIRTARASGKTTVFCSVRDVLVSRGKNQTHYDERAVAWLNENFDAVLIHSDPDFVRLNETFSCYAKIRIPALYTGYISGAQTACAATRLRRVVVSAGGGRVGQDLLAVASEASDRFRQQLDLDMLVVAGPNGTKPRVANGGPGPSTVDYVADLPAAFACSAISISQCGYNTAIDVLKTRTPAIFVPFEAPSEDEQLKRAELLSSLGCALLLRQKALTAETLVNAASTVLRTQNPDFCDIDLGGAARSGQLIHQMCGHA
jgi:predicted glycosyltransferase